MRRLSATSASSPATSVACPGDAGAACDRSSIATTSSSSPCADSCEVQVESSYSVPLTSTRRLARSDSFSSTSAVRAASAATLRSGPWSSIANRERKELSSAPPASARAISTASASSSVSSSSRSVASSVSSRKRASASSPSSSPSASRFTASPAALSSTPLNQLPAARAFSCSASTICAAGTSTRSFHSSASSRVWLSSIGTSSTQPSAITTPVGPWPKPATA